MSTLSRQLKESWALVEDRADQVAGYLYARLFLVRPELREMFSLHMDQQRERFVTALVRAIQVVDSVEQFDGLLRQLGRDHRKYGVRSEHYQVFGDCLIEAVRAHSGTEWTAEHARAWREGYHAIADRMLAGASDDAHNPAYWDAEVVGHERRSAEVAVITVRPATPLPYRAGERVSVESPYQPRNWRPYPVGNAPRPDGTLDFHVRAAGSCVVSSSLVWKLRVGDVVRLGPASTGLRLDLASPRDLVCVAGGVGLAPIKALVEELAKTNRTRWVHVFFGARGRDGLYDLPALRELAARCPWLSLVPAVSHEPDAGTAAPALPASAPAAAGGSGRSPGGEEHGLISDVVASYGPWDSHDFYVCGSSSMVNATLAKLRELQVPPTRINHDVLTAR
ncbi:MAG: globin domain-containing protein [Micromonosporaceae bacterium]